MTEIYRKKEKKIWIKPTIFNFNFQIKLYSSSPARTCLWEINLAELFQKQKILYKYSIFLKDIYYK